MFIPPSIFCKSYFIVICLFACFWLVVKAIGVESVNVLYFMDLNIHAVVVANGYS